MISVVYFSFISAGCNFIFADSFGHEDYIIEAAKEYPDVQFSHATGTKAHTEGLDNFHNAFASIYDGRYLAGIVAGMKLNEMIANGDITEDQAKMGYVGAYTYAEVMSGYTSFFLGARSVCPSVTMDVTFTGSWYDETAEKEAANKLIEVFRKKAEAYTHISQQIDAGRNLIARKKSERQDGEDDIMYGFDEEDNKSHADVEGDGGGDDSEDEAADDAEDTTENRG